MTCIKCKHCGEPMFDNGTVGVHIRFVNGALLQSQWCDDSNKVFAEPEFAPSPATKEEKEAMDEHVCKPSCHNPCLLDDRKQPGDDYRLDQSADGLLKRIEDYRTGYSCGYADGKNGGRMRDKDAAANFFGISGVPDVSEHAASPSPATKETPISDYHMYQPRSAESWRLENIELRKRMARALQAIEEILKVEVKNV